MERFRQIPLDLEHAPHYGASEFVIGEANIEAHQWIVSWPDWPENTRMLNIFGPKASGKTHLSYLLPQDSLIYVPKNIQHWMVDVFQEIIEDHTLKPQIFVCECDEAQIQSQNEAFFNLTNQIKLSSHYLLFFSRTAIAQYDISLADLKSRLRAVISQPIHLPDDELLSAVLMKLAADKQMFLTPEMVRLIIARGERSFDAVKNILNRLDKLAMAEQKAVSLHLVRQLLSQ